MQNKDKDDGIEDSPLDMLLVILLEGASKEVVVVVTPSSLHESDLQAILGQVCRSLHRRHTHLLQDAGGTCRTPKIGAWYFEGEAVIC